MPGVASTLVLPMGPPPHVETRLERLARKAELEPDDLRDLLYELVDEAERAERQRILAEAFAESLVESPGRK
jgi:hypothetical protein